MGDRKLFGGALGDTPELQVPDLSGAVPATDQVECVRCGARVPLAKADIVGLGYRCTRCTTQASIGELQGQDDVADNLSIGDREQLARNGLRLAAISFGLLVAVGGLVAIGVPLVAAKYASPLALSGALGLDRWRRFRSRTPALASARVRPPDAP